jgi:hypothetical protein
MRLHNRTLLRRQLCLMSGHNSLDNNCSPNSTDNRRKLEKHIIILLLIAKPMVYKSIRKVHNIRKDQVKVNIRV